MLNKKILASAIPFLLFFGFAILYIHNLARGVYAGDVGDFTTASSVGGIAHAPGYPLLVLLGFFLTRFSFFPSPAFAVGLISAFAGVLCLVFLYFLSFELTKNKFASVLTSITLGFTFLFWFYSEVAEVFVLNALFIVVLFYIVILLRRKASVKLLHVFSFVLGLSLTNHQTIVFIFPSLALLLFRPLKKYFSWKQLLSMPVFFLLGFSIYLYPYIATLHHPIVNWDPVTNIQSFFHLFLRQDYGTFNAGPFGKPVLLQRFVILKFYATSTLAQLTIPVIILSILGIFSLWKKNRAICFSFLLAFFFIGPLFIFYAGFPPTGDYFDGVFERFLLASQVIILFFLPMGFILIQEILSRISQKKISMFLFSAVFLLIPAQLFFYNFSKTDLSHFYFTEQFAKDILLPLPPHAVLFTTGDTATFNVWYVRYALGLRKDVDIVNLGGLRVDVLYQKYVKEYLLQHSHEPKIPKSELTREVLLFIAEHHPIFSLSPVQPITKDNFTWIPEGLSYQLLGDKAPIPPEKQFIQITDNAWGALHIPDEKILHQGVYGDVSAAEISGNYITAMLATGDYFLTKYKDPKEAKIWFDNALTVDPSTPNVHAELAMYYLSDGKQCQEAVDEFKKSIEINPIQIPTYILLYETYLECSHNPKEASSLATKFEATFQVKFSNVLDRYFPKKKK